MYNTEHTIPTAEEVNDWLHEHNSPWSRQDRWLDAGLPGYNELAQETYYNQSIFDIDSYSALCLLIALIVCTFIFGSRMHRRHHGQTSSREGDDDEYIKVNGHNSLLNKFMKKY